MNLYLWNDILAIRKFKDIVSNQNRENGLESKTTYQSGSISKEQETNFKLC